MRVKPLPPADSCFVRGNDLLNGAFVFPNGLRAIVSDGTDWLQCFDELPAWEHVSVSREDRCPTWEEMCWVKDLFWRPVECVIQLHVPAADHINFHPHCLHMWRPIGIDLPMPPGDAVAPKGAQRLTS
jgi:hypothetical protein